MRLSPSGTSALVATVTVGIAANRGVPRGLGVPPSGPHPGLGPLSAPLSPVAMDPAASGPAAVPPARLDCSRAYAALSACLSPQQQVHAMYLHGTTEDCGPRWKVAWACMRASAGARPDDADLKSTAVADDPRLRRTGMWTYRTKEEARTFWDGVRRGDAETGV